MHGAGRKLDERRRQAVGLGDGDAGAVAAAVYAEQLHDPVDTAPERERAAQRALSHAAADRAATHRAVEDDVLREPGNPEADALAPEGDRHRRRGRMPGAERNDSRRTREADDARPR